MGRTVLGIDDADGRKRERRVDDGSKVHELVYLVEMPSNIVIKGDRHHEQQHRDADLLTEQQRTF